MRIVQKLNSVIYPIQHRTRKNVAVRKTPGYMKNKNEERKKNAL